MINNLKYELGSKIEMKKKHPCGGNTWEVIRVGADIKAKCLTCNHQILLPRIDFNKRIKKIIKEDVK